MVYKPMLCGYSDPSVRIDGFGFEYQELDLPRSKNKDVNINHKPLTVKPLIMVELK
jgi:hypothetical protein